MEGGESSAICDVNIVAHYCLIVSLLRIRKNKSVCFYFQLIVCFVIVLLVSYMKQGFDSINGIMKCIHLGRIKYDFGEGPDVKCTAHH